MNACRLLLLTTVAFLCAHASAEQFARLGSFDVHYVVIPTVFLQPDVAAQYGLVRANDRALVNISILRDGTPVAATLDGAVTNLLSQRTALEFREVREGSAIYYLASVRHVEEEMLRFDIEIQPEGGGKERLRFQQKLYRGAP